ncbi:MAG: MaoC family dehydratase N-terminal domain-containing protein [Myxococcales bacterium]|nr:MaoC family dehydratase N-terminal domain-containing protein [Myxococcales bacterium]HQY63667.1 MaoC/PaaZ C-terminal domain-containing protein [Polyangiaceae bacterium]
MASAREWTFDELTVGQVVDASYEITPDVYSRFLEAFGDYSPIHTDGEVARSRGFLDRVMHGAILNGFVSHFVGMVMPGARSLLLSTDLRYAAPCYLGDRLRLRATLEQKVDTMDVVAVRVVFDNETQNTVAARGRVQVKVAR